jgi:hypothetical protein
MPGKRISFDQETYTALDLLARDRMMTFQELADEAFRDLLRKHNRPTELKEALRKSARASAEVVPFKPRETEKPAGGRSKKKSAPKAARKRGKKTAKRRRR